MFSHQPIVLAVLTFIALICARAATAQSDPVANKIAEFQEEQSPAALAFNSDGSQLAVNFMVASDGVHIWNWLDPKAHPLILGIPGGAGDGFALSYSPDGALLAVRHDILDDGRVIRVWNAQTGELVHDVVEHQGQGVSRGMAFSPDNKLLVLTMTRSIREPGDQVLVFRTDSWDLAWGLRTVPFLATVIAFRPDGKVLALGGHEDPGQGIPPKSNILMLDIATRRIIATIDAPFLGGISPVTLAWSQDGLHIAAATNRGDNSPEPEVIKVFEVATGKKIAGVVAKTATVTGLSFSPKGKYLIAGSIDDTVRIMDARSYALLQSIPGDGRLVAVSRDSRYLAISAYPKISVWELK